MRYDRRPLSELAPQAGPETTELLGLPHDGRTEGNEGSIMVTAMGVDKCERCGGLVQKPNAIGVDRHSARLHGLVKIDSYPPEGYYNEEPQQRGEPEEVCDRCYGHEIEDAPWQEDEALRPVTVGEVVETGFFGSPDGTVRKGDLGDGTPIEVETVTPNDDPGRRPIEGTSILFGGDFVRVVLSSEWAPRQRATNPYAVLLLYRTNSPFGKAKGYLTTIAVQHESGDVGFVSSHYDLTAVEGAEDFVERCSREGV